MLRKYLQGGIALFVFLSLIAVPRLQHAQGQDDSGGGNVKIIVFDSFTPNTSLYSLIDQTTLDSILAESDEDVLQFIKSYRMLAADPPVPDSGNCTYNWDGFASSYEYFADNLPAEVFHGEVVHGELEDLGVDPAYLEDLDISDFSTVTMANVLDSTIQSLLDDGYQVIVNFSNGIVPCETVKTLAAYEALYYAGYNDEDSESLLNISRSDITQIFQRSYQSAVFSSYIGLSSDEPLLRQAVTYAIDRGSIVDEHFAPEAELSNQYIPSSFSSMGDISIEFDPELAIELLEEAGYPNGEGLPPLDIYHSANVPPQALEFIQANLEEIGIFDINFIEEEAWVFLNEYHPEFRWWSGDFESFDEFNQAVNDNFVLLPLADTLQNDALRAVLQTHPEVMAVGAAGNSGLDFPFYPAAWPEVTSVSASEDAASVLAMKPRSVLSNAGEILMPGISQANPGSAYTSFAAPRLSYVLWYNLMQDTLDCQLKSAPPFAYSHMYSPPRFDNIPIDDKQALNLCPVFSIP